jgi:hypothetical protein
MDKAIATHLGKHYRAELTITAWDEDTQLRDAPIVVKGFIPLSFDETTDRRALGFRTEILGLAVEGLRDFAERQREDPTEAWIQAATEEPNPNQKEPA